MNHPTQKRNPLDLRYSSELSSQQLTNTSQSPGLPINQGPSADTPLDTTHDKHTVPTPAQHQSPNSETAQSSKVNQYKT